MTVGAPAAEAKFREAIVAAQKQSKNVKEFPVIYVGWPKLPILPPSHGHLGFPWFATQELALSK